MQTATVASLLQCWPNQAVLAGTPVYDDLGGRTGNCLYLKLDDEQEVTNTVKTGTRKNLHILKTYAWIS